MSAKPICSKCGVEHWRFVACDAAPAANAEDAAKAAAAAKKKVIPVWRSPEGHLMFPERKTTWATSFSTPLRKP